MLPLSIVLGATAMQGEQMGTSDLLYRPKSTECNAKNHTPTDSEASANHTPSPRSTLHKCEADVFLSEKISGMKHTVSEGELH